eukprot:gnl/TRDRNA2_/TRDRNA2_80525_c0_seq1.p1 gnl/TRDRNA2_/TRDRNA2_80525_c0~~gnl/TRDRNA2_/TRDRNA2_80525_c0_seq1.p1  ORF type:complete len:605 (+),score=122.32 gnl/TRDRNA2_/TRDRNA2_80525_c0_seq1:77-1891(+)
MPGQSPVSPTAAKQSLPPLLQEPTPTSEASPAPTGAAAGVKPPAVKAAPDTNDPLTTAAPIGALSRAAFQDTLAELSAHARQAQTDSTSALRTLRIGAERRLGIEVKIEDPALRELFGHLLQVEELLLQVRQNGEALANGAEVLADGPPRPLPANPAAALVSGDGVRGGTPQPTGLMGAASLSDALAAVARSGASEAEVSDAASTVDQAAWITLSLSPNASEKGSARYSMVRRLIEEVFEPIESQLAEHERIRGLLREQQNWRRMLERCQWEVVALKKSGSVSAAIASAVAGGLKPLAGGGPSARKGSAEERLQAAMAKVKSLDEEVLAQLLDIRDRARQIIIRPWVALARIRADFFAALAATWAPVATAFGAAEDEKPALPTGTVVSSDPTSSNSVAPIVTAMVVGATELVVGTAEASPFIGKVVDVMSEGARNLVERVGLAPTTGVSPEEAAAAAAAAGLTDCSAASRAAASKEETAAAPAPAPATAVAAAAGDQDTAAAYAPAPATAVAAAAGDQDTAVSHASAPATAVSVAASEQDAPGPSFSGTAPGPVETANPFAEDVGSSPFADDDMIVSPSSVPHFGGSLPSADVGEPEPVSPSAP